jgi:Icc-related predicted phosphoesterase
VVDVGRLQDTMTTCTPLAWLNTMHAFRPLARQRLYSAEKSAVETAGGGLEQAGSTTLVHAPPLTTLAHVAVGETKEVGGRGEAWDCWLACL